MFVQASVKIKAIYATAERFELGQIIASAWAS